MLARTNKKLVDSLLSRWNLQLLLSMLFYKSTLTREYQLMI